MQLIWGKIHAVNNLQQCSTDEMPSSHNSYTADQDDANDPQYVQCELFYTLFSHHNSAMVVMVGLNTNSHISEITKEGINRML